MPTSATWDQEIVAGVQTFVQRYIAGNAQNLEESDHYPEDIVSQIKDMGLFGIAIPHEYGGIDLSIPTYAKVMEELAYGWTTLNCFINGHSSASSILTQHGTEQQKNNYLPRMATGELRVAIALTEP